jgi:hypothetical protein
MANKNQKSLIAIALKSECQGRFTKENVIFTGVGKINATHQPDKPHNKD